MEIFNLFRSKLKNSDPAIRADAARRLQVDDVQALAGVLRDDRDASVRRIALKKLRDPDILAEIAKNDTDEAIRKIAAEKANGIWIGIASTTDRSAAEAALGKIEDQSALARVACEAELDEICKEALGRIEEPRALGDVARRGVEPAIRLQALERVTANATLRAIATGDEDEDVAIAAIEKLDDIESLDAVVKKARRKGAKKRAAEKLKAAGGGALTTNKQRRSAQREMVVQLETLSQSFDWAAAEPQVETARDAWRELGTDASPELRARFDAAWNAFFERHAQKTTTANATTQQTDGAADGSAAGSDSASVASVSGQSNDTGPRSDSRIEKLVDEAEELAGERDLKKIGGAWRGISKSWSKLDQDRIPAKLAQRFESAAEKIAIKEEQSKAREAQRQQDNFTRFEKLVAEVEGLSKTDSLKDALNAINKAQSALKNPKPMPGGAQRDVLSESLETGLAALKIRVGELREADEWNRWSNEPAREQLCVALEALAEEEDLRKVANGMRDLEKAWREAGPVSQTKATELRERFRVAMKAARARADAYFKEQDSERKENLKKKLVLCEKAETLKDSTEWKTTAEQLKALQAEWKGLGPAPKTQADAVWKRFRSACDTFFEARKVDLSRLDGEREANLVKKQALCEKAEALSDSTDWDTTANELKRLQADWKKIGPAPRAKADAVWKRFRGAADKFFDRHARRDQIAIDEKIEGLTDLASRVELLASECDQAEDEDARDDVCARVKEALTERRKLGAFQGPLADAAHLRIDQAVAGIVDRHPKAFAGTDHDPATRLRKRDAICKKLEAIVEQAEQQKPAAGNSVSDMAERLRQGLAERAFSEGDEDTWAKTQKQVDDIEGTWKRVRAVADERGKAQDEQFAALKARFDAAKKAAS